MAEPIKVLALVQIQNHRACSAIRTLWPLVALHRRADFECEWFDANKVYSLLVSGKEGEFAGRDIYIVSRLHGPTKGDNPYKYFTGKSVYETDDDLSDVHRDFGTGQWEAEFIHYCDAVTVSTKHLGEVIAKHGKPVYVVPNHVNTEFYSKVSLEAERMDNRLTIGLIGTGSHWSDWIEMIEPLKKIKENYPGVRIMCGGYRPPYLKGIVDVFYGALPFEQYPALIRQADIRLSPLDHTDGFNLSKSPIAALEAMACSRPVGGKGKLGGAVAVTADHIAYKGTVQHRTNGMLVKPGEWYDTLVELIENVKLRERLALAGHKWVCNERDISKSAPMWAHAYHDIAGR